MNAPHERTGALKAALEYGKRGWPVFQTVIQGGKFLPASAAKDGGPRWDATTDPRSLIRDTGRTETRHLRCGPILLACCVSGART